jgi:hypothetical protein
MSSDGTDGVAGNQSIEKNSVDMASVLAKIQSLEREKQQMTATLNASNAKLSKFQEGKKVEMESLMTTTISKWLEGLDTKVRCIPHLRTVLGHISESLTRDATQDVDAKDQLKTGLQHLIDDGNESGVWNVIACASSRWVDNVNSIETLTNEVNSYKEKEKELQNLGFANESSRISGDSGKRKAEDMSDSAPRDIWNEFETIMMQGGGNKGEMYTQHSGGVDIHSVK